MKKWAALLLALLMTAALLTGCGEPDPEKEAAKVVAEVNGENILKGDALKVYDFVYYQMAASAAQSGQSVTESQVATQSKANTLGFMTEALALEQKMRELGGDFTDEELAAIQTEADDEIVRLTEYFMSTYGDTEESAKAALDEMGYTPFVIGYLARNSKVIEKLRTLADVTVEVTPEQVQARYDELAAAQTETYTSTPNQFIQDYLGTSGNTVYTVPEGVRLIKNLVVGLPEEINTQIEEKDAQVQELSMQQYNLMFELFGTQDLSDERKAELETQMAALDEQATAINEEMDALIAQGQEEVREKADEILALAQAEDADFDALMAEYSTDTATGSPVEEGYPVIAGNTFYVPEFTEGAMALESIGDISELIASDFGFHILKYEGDLTPGQVPLEEVSGQMEAQIREEEESAAYEEQQVKWIEEAKIKTHINRF